MIRIAIACHWYIMSIITFFINWNKVLFCLRRSSQVLLQHSLIFIYLFSSHFWSVNAIFIFFHENSFSCLYLLSSPIGTKTAPTPLPNPKNTPIVTKSDGLLQIQILVSLVYKSLHHKRVWKRWCFFSSAIPQSLHVSDEDV